MKKELIENTEIAAYFLWEYTGYHSALSLWYCAEDIGFFLESIGVFSVNEIEKYINIPKGDEKYKFFIRNVAYRIFASTNTCDHLGNWFIAESLMQNNEWIASQCKIAVIYRAIRKGQVDGVDLIRSDSIRRSINE